MVDEQTKQIHIKLAPALHRELKVKAAISDLTIQEMVVKALESYLGSDEITDIKRDKNK